MTEPHTITSSFKIHGRFEADTLLDWVTHRAKLLDLAGCGKVIEKGLVEVLVSGNPVLVDAMEVACSLGPGKAFIDRVQVEEQPLANLTNGFEIIDDAMNGKNGEWERN